MSGQPGVFNPAQGMYDPNMAAAANPQGMMGQPQPQMQVGQPQPPMMGGVPPPAYGAQAQLQQMEHKKKDKEEKQKKKEMDHQAKMVRSAQRLQEDNKSCATLLIMWGILNGMCWAAPLLGDRWWFKVWHGMSIDKLEVFQGLFNMEINIACKDTIDSSLCNSIKDYSDHNGGHWTIAELEQHMCGTMGSSSKACHTMGMMYYAGYPPFLALPCAAVLEVLAVVLLSLYWYGKPTSFSRELGNKCAAFAAFLGSAGITAWMIICPYTQELPRFWAEEKGHQEFANGAVFGLKSSFAMPMGWCTCMVLFAVLSSMVRFFCQWTLPQHLDEADSYDESSKLVSETGQKYDEDK